jgi:hypothetical protein
MSVWAVSMVRDEADIVERTVEHMLTQVDHVLIADNGSTDGTRDILGGLPVIVRDDPETAYYQSRKMSALAREAMENGAEWIVPFDADEVWVAYDGTVKDTLEALPDEAMICEAMVFDHVAVHDSLMSPWRRAEPLPLRKVAVRAHEGLVIHQGNHGVTFFGIEHPLRATGLAVHHFPYRTPEQMIRKARNGKKAYDATDLPKDIGAHWRGYGALSDDQLRDVFETYFFTRDPEADGLIRDRCPA